MSHLSACVLIFSLGIFQFGYGSSKIDISITRSEVIQRAEFWYKLKVSYSQTNWHSDPEGIKYRTDCSGYVSMVWNLSLSMTTKTLDKISKPIEKNELLGGDIILKQGIHVVIFHKWSDEKKTKYWAYDQTPNFTAYHEIRYPYRFAKGYAPYRYSKITTDKTTTVNTNRESCSCPPSRVDLVKHYSAMSINCGSELLGNTCKANGLYVCSYQNNYNKNEGVLEHVSDCKFECIIPLRSNARCKDEDFAQIMDNFLKAKEAKYRGRRMAMDSDTEMVETPCDSLSLVSESKTLADNGAFTIQCPCYALKLAGLFVTLLVYTA